MNALRKKILGALREEGFEISPDLESRVEHFLSCVSRDSGTADLGRVLEWLEEKRRGCRMEVEEIPMSHLDQWIVDPQTGVLSHATGEFFRVIGIRIKNASRRETVSWCQPIIYQAEMGILGILVQRRNAIDHFLLQAKAEPGNIGKIQLSPTLQSTVSNLRRAHGGRKSLFADFFERPQAGSVIYAKYQGEDGGRLHLKKNLNMLVRVDESAELDTPDDFIWLTMFQIKELLKHENVINIAVRSIISVL